MEGLKMKFEAIGTIWEIDIPDVEGGKNILISENINKIIQEFDLTYSRFLENSIISSISRKVGIYKMPENSKNLFKIYQKLYKITDGLFTPLIGNTMESVGYDATYSFKEKAVKSPLKWEDAIFFSYPNLNVKKPVMLDFGAAGKGYLVDLISGYLSSEGLETFTVDGGGDIYTKSHELTVGLEHPENINQVIGKVILKNKAIASSAGNRRKWGKYHHIINPKTLASPTQILSTWVIANECITADALATCLFLVNPEILKDEFDFEYLILYSDYSIKKSLHFNAELFYDNRGSK